VSSKKHVVRVNIVGEEHMIRSDAPPEHTRAVAEYVDRTIRAITNSGSGMVVEPYRAAILAAMKITDELFGARAAAAELDQAMEALSGEMRRWLPPSKRGTPSSGLAAESSAKPHPPRPQPEA
jgi:cell division protein ZapA